MEMEFQSTPPMQGATTNDYAATMSRDVSIHAPYAGSDRDGQRQRNGESGFNPRPLCRERHLAKAGLTRLAAVSIHAPYAGSDSNFSQKFFLIFSRNRQIIILNT